MRQELESALDAAKTLTVSELPELLGDLEQIRAVAMARLMTPTIAARPDELLSVEQTAARLNVSEDYLYRHSTKFKFARRIGRKLLFSSSGLDAYLRKSR
jgi:excisionase family DNA binding protein